MNSVRTKRFRDCFDALPAHVRRQAGQAYQLWRDDPSHRSLEFKPVGGRLPAYSVRIGLNWRALCVREGETWIWYWIGSHAEYDILLRRR
jgi:hypothetical protein